MLVIYKKSFAFAENKSSLIARISKFFFSAELPAIRFIITIKSCDQLNNFPEGDLPSEDFFSGNHLIQNTTRYYFGDSLKQEYHNI